MKKDKKHYTAEFKVQVMREHLENQVPIGKLSEQFGIIPNLLYSWKKELFQGALPTFNLLFSGSGCL